MNTIRATCFTLPLAILLISISKTLGYMDRACQQLCGDYADEGPHHDGSVFQRNCPPGQTWNRWKGCMSADDVLQPRGLWPFVRPSKDGSKFKGKCPPGQIWNRWKGCMSAGDVMQPRSSNNLDGTQFQRKCPPGQIWNRWKGCMSANDVVQPRSSTNMNQLFLPYKPNQGSGRPLDGTVFDAPCPAGFIWNRWQGCTNSKIIPY